MSRVMAMALCLLVSVLLSGCVSFGPAAQQPSLDAADLLGTWVSSDGSSVTFAGAGSFAAAKINYGKYVIPTCGLISGSGIWQFVDSNGQTSTSSLDSANIVALFFRKVSSSSKCSGVMQLTSWDTGSTPGLCVQEDPDTPCDGYIFSKR